MNRNEFRLTAKDMDPKDMDLQYEGLSKPIEGYGVKDTTYVQTE